MKEALEKTDDIKDKGGQALHHFNFKEAMVGLLASLAVGTLSSIILSAIILLLTISAHTG